MSELLDNLTSVEVMHLTPGDVIVATFASRIRPEDAERYHEILTDRFPDHKVLILSDGVSLSLTREDSE